MKHLVVSFKTASEALDDFRRALESARKKKPKVPYYGIGFDNKKDFNRFARNLFILRYILVFKPKSVYELAKITQIDVSNLNKLILFFEEFGVITVKTSKHNGRTIRTPQVEYDTVEFRLAA